MLELVLLVGAIVLFVLVVTVVGYLISVLGSNISIIISYPNDQMKKTYDSHPLWVQRVLFPIVGLYLRYINRNKESNK